MQAGEERPTPAMLAFFDRRTNEHIARVRRCLLVLAENSEHAAELVERAELHDASKFGPAEHVPYVWLTEYHRCRRAGEPFEYPPGMGDRVRVAVRRHVTTNRHHPDFHADPNDMSEVDLIEMVCDWTAMAQEYSEPGGSARGWADRVIGTRIAFDEQRSRFVHRLIDELDRQLAGRG